MNNSNITWNLVRQSDGSFTLRSYGFNLFASPVGLQLSSQTPDFQQQFLACSGHSAGAVVPPSGWSFLSDPLLGTMARDPAAVMLGTSGPALGGCLTVCNNNEGYMQTVVATASGSVLSLPTYTVTPESDGILTADLNNDGLADVIVTDPNLGGVFVFLTNPDGTLAAPTSLALGFESDDVFATVADLNGDGKIDLALTCLYGNCGNTITVLLGKGDGTFGSPITLTANLNLGPAVAADVNGDGKLDLVTTSQNPINLSSSISVFLGNGDGTFQPAQTWPTGGSPSAIAVGDLNHDGKPDVVVTDTNGAVQILLNAGGGTFPTVTGYVSGFSSDTFEFFLMDFDWDGNTDIVFAAGHPDALTMLPYSPTVTVLFGNGDGTFNGIPAYRLPAQALRSPSGLAIADFNGDGKPDEVAGTQSGIAVLLGNGNGTFAPQVVNSQQGSTSLAAGAFRTNGNADFIATNATSGISVYLGNGNGTFQQPASINTSGRSPEPR